MGGGSSYSEEVRGWGRVYFRGILLLEFYGMLLYLELKEFVELCLYHNSDVVFIHCRTILLSVISLLNEPNTFSPANVDASVMFRKWRDSKGKDSEYEKIVK